MPRLCLTRKHGERIVIRANGPCVIVIDVQLQEGRAKIGIEAPAHVEINREEIDAAKYRQQILPPNHC